MTTFLHKMQIFISALAHLSLQQLGIALTYLPSPSSPTQTHSFVEMVHISTLMQYGGAAQCSW